MEGINNLDAILTEVSHHIDAVWIRTLDARVSIGLPFSFSKVPTEPEWLVALDKYYSILKKHDKPSSGFGLGAPEQVAQIAKSKCIIFINRDVFAILKTIGDLMEAKKWPARNFSAMNKGLKSV
jgi:4-hydroxy-2-oxoheptanedioate aldolase